MNSLFLDVHVNTKYSLSSTLTVCDSEQSISGCSDS